jgi:hypothetical protein
MSQESESSHASSENEIPVRYTKAQIIWWWGVPIAVISTYWTYGNKHGFALSEYWTLDFALRLAFALFFIAYLGGRYFAGRLNHILHDTLDRKPRE